MKRICVITGTRAEYGLLFWTMKKLLKDENFKLSICVTGMHLSPEFNLTFKSIINDGFDIDEKVEMLLSSDSSVGISKSIGLGVISFSEVFDRIKPDLILVLGDRFEIFSACIAAMISNIPIAHCHGGEATEGLIDEAIRHSITKMSHIHFTSTNDYKKRVEQMGEDPSKVFNVGALGIENINKLKLFGKEDFEKKINLKLRKIVILITFHPVTLENSSSEKQFSQLINAIDKLDDSTIIFTKPNADMDGRVISELIDYYVIKNPKKSSSTDDLRRIPGAAFFFIPLLLLLLTDDMDMPSNSSSISKSEKFKVAPSFVGSSNFIKVGIDGAFCSYNFSHTKDPFVLPLLLLFTSLLLLMKKNGCFLRAG